MAAGIASTLAPQLRIASAGTAPGTGVNTESAQALAEIGIDISEHRPHPVTPELIAAADLVVVLGDEAQLDTGDVPMVRWQTDEPSTRGIDGMDRMRLVRDDIAARVADLLGADGQ